MSFFPRSYFAPEASFTPLFRLLDDFDNYSREVSSDNNNNAAGRGRGARQSVQSFTPRFDVKETDAAYELHGELPGIEKQDVHIEFTEPQTIVIRGRTERSYTAGTPPAGFVEDAEMSGAITEGEGKTAASPSSHKATVEDEAAEQAKEKGTVAKAEKKEPQQQQREQQPSERYWVSERSVGEFSRTFNFPSLIDQDGVTANLNNGILAVTVPKAKKHESRRIAIN